MSHKQSTEGWAPKASQHMLECLDKEVRAAYSRGRTEGAVNTAQATRNQYRALTDMYRTRLRGNVAFAFVLGMLATAAAVAAAAELLHLGWH